MASHLQMAQFVSLVPFDTTKQYEDYIARLHQVPRVIDQVIELLQEGKRDKLMPPEYLLEKMPDDISDLPHTDPASALSWKRRAQILSFQRHRY